MSTHEHRLAQWLDAPESDPEGHLDAEVLEAVYALRPDLAPAPRITADDILADVMEGPLAAAPTAVPSSLPAPAEQAQTGSPTPANRSIASWGGWGGIGLALAAAATFALVGLPTLQGSMERAPAPVAAEEMKQAPAAAAPPMQPTQDAEADAGLEGQAAPPPPPAKGAPARPPRARPVPAPPPVAAVPQAPDAFDMADEAPLRTRDLIPELAEDEEQDDDAVADAAPTAEPSDSPASDTVEEEEARRLDALRAHATRAMGPVPSWKAGLPANEVQRLEKLFADATSLAPRAAGDRAATAIQAPAAVAHHAAALAVDHYLAAGDASAAANAAMRGLQFRTRDAGWATLAVRYADLIRGSEPSEAARWYEEAAAAQR